MSSLFQDLRYTLRTLGKNPGLAAIAVLTIAIGIGASTTIFSWTRAVLLNPLPGAAAPSQVVELEEIPPDGSWVPTSYLDFTDFRDHLKLVESMSVAQPLPLAVGDEQNVERAWSELVSGNFFDVLRLQPEQGRFFSGSERDDAQNSHPVVVISHSYWVTHYRSAPAVVGSTLRINRFPYTIIGVAPEAFHGSMPGLSFDMWTPATMYGQLTSTGNWMLRDRKTRMFRVLARLGPGIAIEQARAEVQSLAHQMAVADANTNEGMSATLLPVWKSHYGLQSRLLAPLSILMAACGVVLLIVCANLAHILLARATTRQKEFSIRLALGAPRSRLVRQLLTESLAITVAGTLAGLLITSWLGGSLQWLVPRSSVPSLARVPLDTGVLFFTTALAFVVAILAGLAPALHAAGENFNDMLKEGGRTGTAGAHSKRLRALLMTSEMALAVVALIGAGLFVKSFRMAQSVHPGFDPNNVALARFSLSSAGYGAKQADSFCRRLREQLEHEPGVTAVSYADYAPLGVDAGSWEDLEVQGYVPGPSENMKLYRNLVSPGYFDLMKIPLLEGRDFDLRDDLQSQPVMIVNQQFVRHFIPDQNAVGRKVHGWGKWFTIVGVVRDSKIYRLTEASTPYFYVPIRQIYRPEMGLIFYVRTSGLADGAIASIRREAHSIDPAVSVFDTVSLNDFISGSLFGQRIAASLLGVLAGVALLLAAIGLYGVMAYSVAQRTVEIGIRVTLGAQQREILRMIVSQGMLFTFGGFVAGALIAAALARIVSAELFAVSPADPAIYAAAAAFTIVIALASTAVPALRATRVDPIIALRQQ